MNQTAARASIVGYIALDTIRATLRQRIWQIVETLLRGLTDGLAGGRLVNYAQLATDAGGQWLKLLVLSAMTLAVASYARTQLFAAMTGFLAYAVCHLQHFAHAAGVRPG